MNIVKYLHLLALALWLGGMVFFSFAAAPSIFKTLDRQTAGIVVGDIFPKYFLMGYISAAVLVGTLWYMGRGHLSAIRIPFAIALTAAALTFVSGLVVGAKAREIKAQMYATQDNGQKEELRKAFGKIHAVSSVINLAIMLLLLAYLWHVPKVINPSLLDRFGL